MASVKHTLLNLAGKKYLFIFNKDCLTAHSNYALMHSHHKQRGPAKKSYPGNGRSQKLDVRRSSYPNGRGANKHYYLMRQKAGAAKD